MDQDNKLVFVTHNKGKVESANKYFEGKVEFQSYDYDFKEIRSDSIEEVSIAKVLEAYEMTKMPTIALDAGFYVKKLNGFPGVYVNHFLSTIGVSGLLKLLEGESLRECCFKQCLVYYNGNGQPKIFWGEHKGTIAFEPKGELSKYDWSEISYIFIPAGKNKTLAEMSSEERIALAEDDDNESAFKRFKEWYIDYLASKKYYNEKERELNWTKTCNYIRENHLIMDISFKTWIKPMRLIECVDDRIVFEYIDDALSSEMLKETVRYIKRKYGKIILDSYNCCVGSEYKNIEIKYMILEYGE